MSEVMQKLVSGLPTDNPAAALLKLAERVKLEVSKNAIKVSEAAEAVALLERFIERGEFDIDYGEKTSTESWLDQLRYLANTILGSDVAVEQHTKNADTVLDSLFGQLSETEFGFAELKPDEKSKIHELVRELRSLIECSKLNPRKKNALFSRLSELELEVDKNSTRTDRFFGMFSEMGFALGGFGEKAKPMFDRMREILEIVYNRRSKDEGVQLPPPSEMTFLEFKKQDIK